MLHVNQEPSLCEFNRCLLSWLSRVKRCEQCLHEVPVRLSTSVNTNMLLQFSVSLKQLPTVRTVMRSSVAVHLVFMSLQVAGVPETFVAQ